MKKQIKVVIKNPTKFSANLTNAIIEIFEKRLSKDSGQEREI